MNPSEKKNPRISLKQVEEVMKTGPSRANELRRGDLEAFARIKRAKLVGVSRERSRMEAKHGPGSAATVRLDEQIRFEHLQLTEARTEWNRVNTPVPARRDDTWSFHGYVRDKDGFARQGFHVGLYEDNSAQTRSVVTVKTDKAGYFKIDRTLRAGEEDGDRLAYYVGVLDAKGHLLHVSENRLTLESNRVSYRDFAVQPLDEQVSRDRIRARYLGEKGKRILHDLNHQKLKCDLAAMDPHDRAYVQNLEMARSLDYNPCPHCFGKRRSFGR